MKTAEFNVTSLERINLVHIHTLPSDLDPTTICFEQWHIIMLNNNCLQRLPKVTDLYLPKFVNLGTLGDINVTVYLLMFFKQLIPAGK
jgi:hypothetical protein